MAAATSVSPATPGSTASIRSARSVAATTSAASSGSTPRIDHPKNASDQPPSSWLRTRLPPLSTTRQPSGHRPPRPPGPVTALLIPPRTCGTGLSPQSPLEPRGSYVSVPDEAVSRGVRSIARCEPSPVRHRRLGRRDRRPRPPARLATRRRRAADRLGCPSWEPHRRRPGLPVHPKHRTPPGTGARGGYRRHDTPLRAPVTDRRRPTRRRGSQTARHTRPPAPPTGQPRRSAGLVSVTHAGVCGSRSERVRPPRFELTRSRSLPRVAHLPLAAQIGSRRFFCSHCSQKNPPSPI